MGEITLELLEKAFETMMKSGGERADATRFVPYDVYELVCRVLKYTDKYDVLELSFLSVKSLRAILDELGIE